MADISAEGFGEEKTKIKDPTKRPTFAEKLMGVRNSQCELYLQKIQQQIEHDESRHIQKLKNDTNLVMYDFKTMDVMKKKRSLEIKKSRSPFLNTEQEEFEIKQAERYLVFDPKICFYTNKKNRYPLRSLAKLNPHHVTPTISKARKILQDMTNERKVQEMQEKRAGIYSRKSIRSVRFHTPTDKSFGTHNNVGSPHKSTARNEAQREKNENLSQVTIRSVPSASERGAGQSLVQFLRREKSCTVSENPEQISILNEEVIPDDFTQCLPVVLTKETGDLNQSKEHDILSLPIVTSEQKSRNYVNSEMDGTSAAFDEVDRDLPRHELILLNEAEPQYPQVRQTKSASVMRTTSNNSPTHHRRYTSASSSAKRKNHYTHAMMRKENREVQSKVNYFLKTFDKSKKHPQNTTNVKENNFIDTRPESRQTVTFKLTGDNQDESLNHMQHYNSTYYQRDLTNQLQNREHNTANEPTSKAQISQQEHQSRMNAFVQGTDKTKQRIHGVPHHSEKRAKRTSATYKLQQMVKELLKNRTMSEKLEYEKMKMESQNLKQGME